MSGPPGASVRQTRPVLLRDWIRTILHLPVDPFNAASFQRRAAVTAERGTSGRATSASGSQPKIERQRQSA